MLKTLSGGVKHWNIRWMRDVYNGILLKTLSGGVKHWNHCHIYLTVLAAVSLSCALVQTHLAIHSVHTFMIPGESFSLNRLVAFPETPSRMLFKHLIERRLEASYGHSGQSLGVVTAAAARESF